jgi:glutamate-1-semialdehyde 2,1-aminomutase
MPSEIDRTRLARLRRHEEKAFLARIPRSLALWQKAKAVMPNGVPMSWMLGLHRHAPVFVAHGEKAWFTDVDGNRYLDMNLSDLSATTGFGHPAITRAIARQAKRGAQFLLPVEDAIAVARLLAERTGMPFWQFTLSASGANVEAFRLARLATAKRRIVMFEGKYHGHFDEVLVKRAGKRAKPSLLGTSPSSGRDVTLIPFNDPDALASELAKGDVACVVTEPALTNVNLVLPAPGFHDALRRLTRKHGALLVIDEAHTVQMGYGGLTRAYGLKPDILTTGKGFGSGVPLGAYGLTEKLAKFMGGKLDRGPGATSPGLASGGTTYASALSLAAARATLEKVLTEEGYRRCARLGTRLADGIDLAIAAHGLPWKAQRLGGRSGISMTPDHPRNGAEAASTIDVDLIDTRRLFMANRGVWEAIATAGPQAGFAHTASDIDHYLKVFSAFLGEIA